MSKKEAPLEALGNYLPVGAYEHVSKYLIRHKVHLTLTPDRSSILGNFRAAHNGKNHQISVNGNLNKYSFLITLLHELGHLITFEKYGPRVIAHGAEWKREYGKILAVFISHDIFPRDIEEELLLTLKNPSASSCAETSLLRVLRKYDPHKPGYYLLEDLPFQSIFKTKNGVLFRKLEQKRKRILCNQEDTSRLYLFSPVTEVILVKKTPQK